ncbi:Fimbria A protein precursor [Serratia quinivorans]|jgi:type 1 fimbria pilin|uniref:fimbrial protein n=1 Tax=Serratia TaxID=613 RepID=UPI0021773EEE|nr:MULTISPECIES: fimbrial protein [Serratia]CAI1103956.1 Fimbria A protein precursor [Serratia quinivorans]CAI1163327.1 Fimbria A protein precursor [Serratia quinivorans]CAI1908995.1 Fimbria A protein precursor [Serratia quinivorans]CAI2143881.1 Fimbria A protein precursor [Serratia quinivorans]CAI2501630.1 Fimbria A protein precursor [Serratia quinivorans]
MKLNKIMMATVMAFGISSTAYAADAGHGKVTFNGSIVDAPCSISQETADQTVNLGQVSNVALAAGGKTSPKQFKIELEDCTVETGKTVQVTFSGSKALKDNKNLLAITGSASGAGVAMKDGTGALIELGKAIEAQMLQNGKNTLQFTAFMQGLSDTSVVTPGEFTAVTDFTLAYP